MYCRDCAYYTELGECRHPKVSRRDHAYFEKACDNFEQKSENTQPETTQEMKEETKPTTAVCQECGRELPLEEFATNRWGRTKYCKECFKKKQQAGSAKPAGTKSKDEKTKDPRYPIDALNPGPERGAISKENLTPFELIASCVGGLERDECIEVLSMVADELREYGYEVTGTICHKIEI